ncbi:hypothetical protein GUITHDRAFT_119792 [Guillardia theta CCMP2712]|uniref:acylaminoacyl-peptidase n=1 Tax=Guillardia theta (strain CCMP2712) TaxID=905079 RepID=L1IDZ3_GUITC|nr:hypothetical protein GUITHDRAFT_119792 [Guillardia theta CCMP2712]EKX34050.1 hypothetical protein GUITHDRAFT_119792 [Guillardia theta CCMP2712]|eukprot:XP_005821030.1 hypothetical protein GUITHDRAFT_119792 [Guillardia theta CCMP2712]
MADKMPSEKLYSNLVSIPSITGGYLISDGNEFPTIMMRRNQKDMKNDEQRSHLATFLPSYSPPSSPSSSSPVTYSCDAFPTDLRDVLSMSVSPSGKLVAMVRVRDVKGVKEQSIEIWDRHALLLSVSSYGELHGPINVADSFACLSWNKEETMLLYAAEEKKAKSSSFFPAKQGGNGEDNGRGREFVFEDDWGELSVDLRLRFSQVKPVDGIPADFAAGQAVWTPDSTGIVFVGFQTTPRRLGLRFYNTRKSKIGLAIAPFFSSEATRGAPQGQRTSSTTPASSRNPVRWLTGDEDWAARSPRFSDDGKKMMYMNAARSSAHYSSSSVLVARWPPEGAGQLERRIVVGIVGLPNSVDEFPGLFLPVEQLPSRLRRVWASDSRHLILQSEWKSRRVLLSIDTEASGTEGVKKIKIGNDCDEIGSWTFLDMRNDFILAAHGPHQAFLIKFQADDRSQDCKHWQISSGASPYASNISTIKWELIAMQAPQTDGMEGFYESIFVDIENLNKSNSNYPLSDSKTPLIVFPHGGPHVNAVQDFYPSLLFWALEGFAVLSVNYRGSSGYGQDHIESLCGKIGRQDVDDMLHATEEVLRRYPHLDRDRVVVCGGSHGGFLSLHLLAQFPSMFKAAAVRNPVTNVATMFGATDIPDWCYTEIGMEACFAQPSAEQYSKAFSMSPMAHVSNVSGPVLLLVGGDDRRVPPFQSKEYYFALKERGADVEMLWYDKHTHGLAETPKGEGDGIVNIIKFFKRKLNMPQ